MADDPHRDLLPVKEGSCMDTCRSSMIDARERHSVVKLDRYQLEDRYLRMRDEVIELKKLTNTQEDKIKRLATKLMRASATPGSCLEAALNFHDDKNRQDSLELENAKLKDKITVLRSQILNHKIAGRSPSRSRRLQICPSSGPTTCRSDIGRIRSSTSHVTRENEREGEKDAKNYVAKIEELEKEKIEMSSKIEDLEAQIANIETGNQRQKVAENVEFIRVWRQMNLQKEELVAYQSRNVSLEQQIRDLKNLVDEKTRNNKDITTALLLEKEKIADMEEQLTRAKSSQLSLHEKDEQIKDLMNEMKILNQHNAELIALSSKCSNVEVENIELRKKISEQLSDNLSLKSAFSNEQANITALQAANQKLIAKLHELQTNIDTLTIQLKSFQSQSNRQEIVCSDRRKPLTVDRQTSTKSLLELMVPASCEDISTERGICKRSCKPSCGIGDRESERNFVSREVQTDERMSEIRRNSRADSTAEKSPRHFIPRSSNRDRSFQHDNGNLTPEEMIKLLEKTQINTPLDAQSISRIRQIESGRAKNSGNASNSRQSSFPVAKKPCQPLANDPCKVLIALYKILRENVDNNSCICDDNYLDENNNPRIVMSSKGEDSAKNVKNNSEKRETGTDRRSSQRHSNDRASRTKVSTEKFNILLDENLEKLETTDVVDQYTETSDCCCEENEVCTYEVDCGYACSQSMSERELLEVDDRIENCHCELAQDSFKNFVSDFSISIQKTFDNIHKSRVTRVESTPYGLYKSWQKPCTARNPKNQSPKDDESKFTVCTTARCNPRRGMTDERTMQKMEEHEGRDEENFNYCIDNESCSGNLPCVSCCAKSCGDGPIAHDNGSFPILITNDQGLLEIHVMCLQLSTVAADIFCNERNLKDLSLHVTWNLWNQKNAFTPSLKYPNFNFNSSSIHRLTNLFEFFDRVLGQTISFRIHMTRKGRTSWAIARAYLNINDILDYPQNKLYYIANFSSILPCTRDKDFGQLSLWIRLSCDLEKIETFKKQRGIFRNSTLARKIWKIEAEEEQNLKKRRGSMENNKSDPTRPREKRKRASKKSDRDSSSRMKNSRIEILQSSEIPSIETSRRFSQESRAKKFTSADSHLTISPTTSSVKRSDSSLIRAMEDEDITSEEFGNEDEEKETGSIITSPKKASLEIRRSSKRESKKVESASVNEFNDLLRNGTILSPRESRSSVQDLGTVFTNDNWRKYRKKSMAAHAKSLKSSVSPTDNNSETSRRFSDTSASDAVVIRIESFSLFQRCPWLDDPKVRRLYVEFSFLGNRGVDLETISVPKPLANNAAYFNYMRKFELDERQHSAQRKMMRDLMKKVEDPTIKFILLSEPLMEEMETKDCEEVGYACLNIRDHILRGRSKDVSLAIMNVEQTEPIGILKITVVGAEAVRRCMSDL